ncbi:MAG: hypothetical protein GC145_07925 [Caulobacter sp.]|nr:hypothetical protein [Caulobacter sp.]
MEDNLAMVQQLAMRISPMLGMIARHNQFEGSGHAIERHDDTVSETEMASVTGEITFSRDMLLTDFTPAELLKRLAELAQQMARGTTENFLSEINRATAAVGNLVEGGGKPLSEDLLIETYSKMEHTFDANGQWQPPTLFTGGDTTAFQKIQSSASFQRRLGDVLRQKRDDFRRREADRVLAG